MSMKEKLGEILGKIKVLLQSKVVIAATLAIIVIIVGTIMLINSEKSNQTEKETTTNKTTQVKTTKKDETDKKTTEKATDATTETTAVETTVAISESTTKKTTTTNQTTAAANQTTAAPQTTVSNPTTTAPVKITSAKDLDPISRVSVHDPSVVVGTDKSGNKCYYIFGSHLAWAKSYDLKNWSTFTNNINTSFNSLFASAFNWSKAGDPQYDNGGNMWAPDVIWNAAMNKWCMYMSINGRSWNSSIVMLTADNLEGDWTVAGPVVYSGFNKSGVYSYTGTDYALATGDTDFSKYGNRFISGAYVWIKDSNNNPVTTASTWNGKYGAHAIDPSVFYDKNGQLWMTYGSWSGGIWMLKLNNSNGLRDYATTYAYNNNVTDPYMGYHLSGGNFVSGEASYIVYDNKTANYYLYVTYYGLFRTGGYQMRLFKSNNVTGPYVDADGTYATNISNLQTSGIKLLGNYHFTSFTGSLQLNANGYMAPGHNSAFIDSDGSYYLIYHTRFNNNTEGHQVRVHQQFLNEDNWLVTAVYENRGDKISPTGYSMDDMAGTYEAVDMGTGNDGAGILSKRTITLNKDGSVSGYLTGTWKYSNSQMTITAGSVQYKGVFFKQKDESNAHNLVMTFSCIGTNSIAILGTK